MIVLVVGLCVALAAVVWGISVLERRGDVEMEDLPLKVFQWVVEAGLAPIAFGVGVVVFIIGLVLKLLGR